MRVLLKGALGAAADVEGRRDPHPFGSLHRTSPLPALAEKRNPAFAIVRIANPLALRRMSLGMMEAKLLNIWVALLHSLGRLDGSGDETGMINGVYPDADATQMR